jgi:vancomycin resistance protein VanW
MSLRGFARRLVPYEARLRATLWRRRFLDWREGVRFATRQQASAHSFDNEICNYALPIKDYRGQEGLGLAKRHNLRLLAAQLTGTVIQPGETFAIWELASRPSARGGYMAAAALRNRTLTSEIGGAICLLATVLYNAALLGAMTIVERRCHSVDSYGDERYFELARDAAIEYGYIDLRFSNPHTFPVFLQVSTDEKAVSSSLFSRVPHGFRVEIDVDPPEYMPAGETLVMDADLPAGARLLRSPGLAGLQVRGQRRILFDDGSVWLEPLESFHHPMPAVIAFAGLTTGARVREP